MTIDEARRAVTETLLQIAPHIDVENLDPDTPLAEWLELDQTTFEKFMVLLGQRSGRPIEQHDYWALRSVRGCTTYLAARS